MAGVLLNLAGWNSNPEQAGGLDEALRTLGEQPFGQVLLGIVALGFALYGVYSFGRARYAKMYQEV
ncbi:MAG: DUF1206 domain-containing protein [Corynebacterium sp.]|nr:DUF1206 domain-containing protein [Corynebacterium sp.]